MKKFLWLLLLAVGTTSLPAMAQSVVVTATISSASGGQPYFSGNYQVSLVDASGNPLQVSGYQSQFTGTLSSAGLLSLSLFPNSQIQAGSQWKFQICSAVPKTLAIPSPAPAASCFSLATAITGAGDISSILNASAPIFYACTQWSGSAWVSCSGNGGTTTDALTAATSGGAAPGSTFNGSAAVTFDYHSFGAAGLAASNIFTGSTTNDFSATSQFKLPVAAGYVSIGNGELGYDTTALNWHGWVKGADQIFIPLASGFVSGDCGQPTATGGSWAIADAGSPCGTGSSGANAALSNLAAVSINTSLLAQTGVDLGSTTHPFRNFFLFGAGTYATTYFELTGTPTSTRTWTVQDANDTFVGRATTDTLTNKSIAASEINSGQLGVANGGTASATLTAHAVLLGEGTSALGFATIGTGGRMLLDQGAGPDPAFTAMSGDCTLAAGGAITCTKTNGASFTTFATIAAGTLTNGDFCTYSSTGPTIACNSSASASISFPQTVAGTTVSGGIPYFSGTTTLSSSTLLAANHILLGGGAGTAPTSDANLDDGATTANTLTYGGTGGISSAGPIKSTPASGNAGILSLASNTSNPTITAGDFSLLGAPSASVTAFAWQVPTATNASAGLLHVGADSANVSQLSVSQVAIADLSATGTPSSGTFLRGDNTWAAPTACATCVTSAASLTSGAIMTGAGSQASQTNTTGTGVLTALGVNTGSAGAFVVNGGALGTPSSGTGTNITGIPGANLNNNSVTATQLAAQYSKWSCETGLGDGLNAVPAGTYLQSFCYNTTGVTVTLTGLKCYIDGGTTSTMNAAGNTLGALLTGAVTCTTAFAAGTQSANVALTSGDYIKFTFVADGTAKQTTFVVTGTY